MAINENFTHGVTNNKIGSSSDPSGSLFSGAGGLSDTLNYKTTLGEDLTKQGGAIINVYGINDAGGLEPLKPCRSPISDPDFIKNTMPATQAHKVMTKNMSIAGIGGR